MRRAEGEAVMLAKHVDVSKDPEAMTYETWRSYGDFFVVNIFPDGSKTRTPISGRQALDVLRHEMIGSLKRTLTKDGEEFWRNAG
jgi:hypothetical protein